MKHSDGFFDKLTFDFTTNEKTDETETTRFYIENIDKKGTASGYVSNNRFVVDKGSYISPNICNNQYQIVIDKRKLYAKKITNNFSIEKITLDNAGQAARFVTGKQVNGVVLWKTAEGKTLKEWLESKTGN